MNKYREVIQKFMRIHKFTLMWFNYLIELVYDRMMDLEEGSGTEDNDTELLEKTCITEIPEHHTR